MAEQKKTFYDELAEGIIQQLEAGTAPWQKPWTEVPPQAPYNPITGIRYRAGNWMRLAVAADLRGFHKDDPNDNRYITFKQAKEAGYNVRKGEKGTRLQYWVFDKKVPVVGDDGKPVMGVNGKPLMQTVELERPYPVSFVVFHASQIDGMPPLPAPEPVPEFQANARAEAIVQAVGIPVSHDSLNQCYYSPEQDAIHLVPRDRFKDAADYYDTLLHEVAHGTGHESRLDRKLADQAPRGTAEYAREELRAEIASWMIGAEIGLRPGQTRALTQESAAYVGAWVKALKDTPMEIARACRDADKILQYCLQKERTHMEEQAKDLAAGKEAPQAGRAAPAADPAEERAFARAVPYQKNDVAAVAEKLTAAIKDAAAKAPDDAEWRFSLDESYGKKEMLVYIEQGKLAGRLATDLERGHGVKCARQWFLDGQDYDKAVATALAAAPEPARGVIPPAPGEDAKWRYLNVPYAEKEDMKKIANEAQTPATWDKQANKWKIPASADPAPFAKWLNAAKEKDAKEKAAGRNKPAMKKGTVCYFPVPKGKEEAVKAAGAEFDQHYKLWRADEQTHAKLAATVLAMQPDAVPEKAYCHVSYADHKRFQHDCKKAGVRCGYEPDTRRWYAMTGAGDLTKISGWFQPQEKTLNDQPQPTMTPAEELTKRMQEIGFVVDVATVTANMDGQPHRCPVEGKPNGTDGYYRAFADGHPNAYMKNHRTGQEAKWTYSNCAAIDPAAMEKSKREWQERKAAQEAEIAATQAAVAKESAEAIAAMPQLLSMREDTPYLRDKGIQVPHADAYLDEKGNLALPVYGYGEGGAASIQSMQTIDGLGHKKFAKGGKLHAGFHAVDGPETLEGAKTIIICEGYATAATLREATDLPTVAAFNCNNLACVAKAIRETHPDAQIVVAGDDDANNPKNPGRAKATQAAAAVNGTAIFPFFPSKVDTEAGFKALPNPTDFNDLAQMTGLENVQRQVQTALQVQAAKRAAKHEQEATQAQAIAQTQQPRRREREPRQQGLGMAL